MTPRWYWLVLPVLPVLLVLLKVLLMLLMLLMLLVVLLMLSASCRKRQMIGAMWTTGSPRS